MRSRLAVVFLLISLASGCQEDRPNSSSKFALPASQKQHVSVGKDRVDYRNKRVLVIGIDKYRHLPQLKYAVNDATAVERVLAEHFGYKPIIVEPLNDKNTDVIRAALESLGKVGFSKEDSLLVFYAGHGLVRDGKGYLAGTDSTEQEIEENGVSVDWVVEQLQRLPCHRALILDCCYSGYLFNKSPEYGALEHGEGRGIRSPVVSSQNGPLGKRSINRYLSRPCFWGMCAARNTVAVEDAGHSVFTAALLAELKERCDSNSEDHVFTFKYLADRVQNRVAGRDDVPQIPDFGRIGTGDGEFVFRQIMDVLTPSEEQEKRLAHTEYARNLNRSQRVLRTEQKLALDLLKDAKLHLPALREFTWQLLTNLCSKHEHVIDGHRFWSGRFTANGSIVTIERGGRAKLWNAFREKETFEVGDFREFTFSPLSDLMALSDPDGVRIVRLTDFKTVCRYPIDSVRHLTFSDKGEYLAVASAGEIVLCNTKIRHVRWKQKALDPRTLTFFADDSRLAYANEEHIHCLSVGEGRQIKTIDESQCLHLAGGSQKALIASKATHLIIIPEDASKRTVRRSWASLTQDRETYVIHPFAFGRDRQSAVVSTSNGYVLQVDTVKGHLQRILVHDDNRGFRSLSLSADGRYLFAVDDKHRARIWDFAQSTITRMTSPDFSVRTGLGDPDGGIIIAGTRGKIVRLDSKQKLQPIAEIKDLVTCLDVTADGSFLAAGTDQGKACLLASDGTPLRTVHHDASVLFVALSQDHSTLITASDDRLILEWNLHDGSMVGQRLQTNDAILAFDVTDDGQVLAVSDASGIVYVSNNGGHQWSTLSLDEKTLWWIALSDSGESLFTGGNGGFLARINPNEMKVVWQTRAHVTTPYVGAVTPDGATLATASDDGIVKFWDTFTGLELASLPIFDRPVDCLAFFGKGRYLCVATSRGQIAILDGGAHP